MKVSGYTTLSLVSDTKISKLILRFSILLLYIELMHKIPPNNDLFTTYINELWNIATDALTSQIELS